MTLVSLHLSSILLRSLHLSSILPNSSQLGWAHLKCNFFWNILVLFAGSLWLFQLVFVLFPGNCSQPFSYSIVFSYLGSTICNSYLFSSMVLLFTPLVSDALQTGSQRQREKIGTDFQKYCTRKIIKAEAKKTLLPKHHLTLMQPLQYDLWLSTAKGKKITHVAAAAIETFTGRFWSILWK